MTIFSFKALNGLRVLTAINQIELITYPKERLVLKTETIRREYESEEKWDQ
jgi:hypothetical protein